MVLYPFLIWVMLCGLWVPKVLAATKIPSIHHELTVTISPATNAISGSDTIHLSPAYGSNPSLSFSLHPDLRVKTIQVNEQALSFDTHPSDLSQGSSQQTVTVHLPESSGPLEERVLTVVYDGKINDPPQASGGLRFVRPDKTYGHIGSEGVYLTYETFWHPTLKNTLSTYDLTVNLPSDWETVTQGHNTSNTVKNGQRTSQWSIQIPSEALTLAANHFIVQKETWHNIQLATYLFPQEARLAAQYLDATARYLALYTDLLGPYPFQKFAVVENFFPSGLGMPSFTLLGQGIVRRGYTQPYSLGHEIVHSWFGNSVFNDVEQGNWVEGLTTYLANYYYEEATGNQEEAFKIRSRMMHEYNLYATPEKEYPIRAFHHKETRIDNAIGYQKTALVFHMLREQVGDEAFFKGVRQIIKQGTGKYVDWKELEQIFSKSLGKDLSWFFQQWVNRPGAPALNFQDMTVQENPKEPGHFTISGTISQPSPAFNVRLLIQVNLDGGTVYYTHLDLDQPTQPLNLTVQEIPRTITIDPDHHLLLRLQRDQLPPMLNGWETDTRRIVLFPKTFSQNDEQAFAALLHRLQTQSGVEIIKNDQPVLQEPASFLLVGNSAKHVLESRSFEGCVKNINVQPDQVRIREQTFKGPEFAFLISCPHPTAPEHTVTFFFGLSAEAVRPVSRLLFFYGWDSYLVFKQGRVVARGMFQPVHSSREFILPAL